MLHRQPIASSPKTWYCFALEKLSFFVDRCLKQTNDRSKKGVFQIIDTTFSIIVPKSRA